MYCMTNKIVAFRTLVFPLFLEAIKGHTIPTFADKEIALKCAFLYAKQMWHVTSALECQRGEITCTTERNVSSPFE